MICVLVIGIFAWSAEPGVFELASPRAEALTAAYAETGRFPEAILTAKQALTLAAAQSKTRLTNELQTEIGLYESNTRCRSTNN